MSSILKASVWKIAIGGKILKQEENLPPKPVVSESTSENVMAVDFNSCRRLWLQRHLKRLIKLNIFIAHRIYSVKMCNNINHKSKLNYKVEWPLNTCNLECMYKSVYESKHIKDVYKPVCYKSNLKLYKFSVSNKLLFV